MEEDYSKPNIIIDNGSAYTKAGLSGEEGPRSVFPTCIAFSKIHEQEYKRIGFDYVNVFPGHINNYQIRIFGDEAESKKKYRNIYGYNYPIDHGVIQNWDDMEKIWQYVFTNELRVDPEEHNVMLTESISNPKENKEKMAQIMFETFNVRGLYIALQPVLSFYKEGGDTGVSIDLGYEISQFVPIFDGFPLSNAIVLQNLGGKDLTEYMRILLKRYEDYFKKNNERDFVSEIKERSCYVALDLEEELNYVESYKYELPDKNKIIVKEERIKCPEVLFDPSIIGKNEKNAYGIGQACYFSIQKCDFDLRKELFNCIYISGGTSMLDGLKERLKKEIKDLAPESRKEEIKEIDSFDGKFATWVGGSILSSQSTFESSWITKQEYEDMGATILHRKCMSMQKLY